MLPYEKRPWTTSALCRDYPTNLWFPTARTSYKDRRFALEICSNCPVKDPCLEYSLVWKIEYGIWGGLSYRDRALVRKKRNKSKRLSVVPESCA